MTYNPGATYTPTYRAQRPAEIGDRVIAYLIDVALMFAGTLAGLLPGIVLLAVSDVLALIVMCLGAIASTLYFLWNYVYRQGVTGQTIGKQYRGIALIRLDNGEFVGFGMSAARYFLASAISQFTCGIGAIADTLWPFFDADRQRLTDKILKFNVVVMASVPVTAQAFNPFGPLEGQAPPRRL